MELRKLTESEVEFHIGIMEEDFDYSDEYEKEVVESIEEMIEQYGLWGWCCVKVTASWRGIDGVDYLGACSYRDEDDFKAGGYWESMKAEALDRLNEEIAEIAEQIEDLIL